MNESIGKHMKAVYFDQDKKLKEFKQEQEKKVEALTKELNKSNQEKEIYEREQDQKLSETKETLERQLVLLNKELSQAKQEIELLQDEAKQLNLAKQELEEKTEEQSRCIKQLKGDFNNYAIFLPTLVYSKKLSTISKLLSFLLESMSQQVLFNNLVDFLRQESVHDCHIMENAWCYRKGDEVKFIWLVTSFKQHQQTQKERPSRDIQSPYFNTGENGYLLNVRLDPYGYMESRGTHLSCCLQANRKGLYDDQITYPHHQAFRVTVINLKDSQNNVSAEKTFAITDTILNVFRSSIIHKILSLTNVENFLLNDTLILKISVKYYSV